MICKRTIIMRITWNSRNKYYKGTFSRTRITNPTRKSTMTNSTSSRTFITRVLPQLYSSESMTSSKSADHWKRTTSLQKTPKSSRKTSSSLEESVRHRYIPERQISDPSIKANRLISVATSINQRQQPKSACENKVLKTNSPNNTRYAKRTQRSWKTVLASTWGNYRVPTLLNGEFWEGKRKSKKISCQWVSVRQGSGLV